MESGIPYSLVLVPLQEFEFESTTRILYAAGKVVTKFIGLISMTRDGKTRQVDYLHYQKSIAVLAQSIIILRNNSIRLTIQKRYLLSFLTRVVV